jgi:uncharacterized membrane protein
MNPLNGYGWAFSLLVSVHLVGIVCGVGTAALVNLRLLGVGLTKSTPARLWKGAMPWTLGGLFVSITAGLLLFSIDPKEYWTNSAFRFKMLCLALALVFYYTLVRKAAVSDARGARASIVASISLGLWALVPFGGILIGSLGSPYPVLLLLHILALICLGGMVAATDVRLLGAGLLSYPARDVVNALRVPKRIAFIVAASSGVLMFSARAGQYSDRPWFWIKLGLLAALAANYFVFRRSVYEKTAEWDGASRGSLRPKIAGGMSLLLSAGVLWAARGPATIKDVMHSAIDPSGDFLFESVQSIADDHGVREKAPHTDAEWDAVRQRVAVLLEAPDLLQGRWAARPRNRSRNPEVENQPEEVQALLDSSPSDFLRRARNLQDAAAVAMRAVDAKDKDALSSALLGIDKACESCHLHYWYPRDKRARQAAKDDGVED